MERAGIGPAQVDDRDVAHLVRFVDRTAAVRVAERRLVGDGAPRLPLTVDVRPAHLHVQVHELGRRDLPRLERVEAVLHAHVVERAAGEAVARAAAEHVHHVVREVAAHAAGVRLRVVALGRRHARARIGRVAERCEVERGQLDRVRVVGMALHGSDVERRPGHAGRPLARVLHVVAHHEVVGQLLGGGPGVGEAALRQDALVDPGVGIRHLLLRQRAAGAAGADRVADLAVGLDQVFLRNGERLRLGHHVAVVAGVVESRGHHREAARERRIVLHARRSAGVVVGPAARAVLDHELVVPLLLRRPWLPGLAGVEEGGYRVLVAVLVARILADDVGDRDALVGGGGRDQRARRWAARVIRLEAAARHRHVLVGVRDRLVALLVGSGRLTHPRLNLGAAEHRTADRVVGDRDLGPGAVRQRCLQGVRAVHESGHEALVSAVRAQRELARHVLAIQRDAVRHAAVHRHERVSARDQVRSVRQHVDRHCGLRRPNPKRDRRQSRGQHQSAPHPFPLSRTP